MALGIFLHRRKQRKASLLQTGFGVQAGIPVRSGEVVGMRKPGNDFLSRLAGLLLRLLQIREAAADALAVVVERDKKSLQAAAAIGPIGSFRSSHAGACQ